MVTVKPVILQRLCIIIVCCIVNTIINICLRYRGPNRYFCPTIVCVLMCLYRKIYLASYAISHIILCRLSKVFCSKLINYFYFDSLAKKKFAFDFFFLHKYTHIIKHNLLIKYNIIFFIFYIQSIIII